MYNSAKLNIIGFKQQINNLFKINAIFARQINSLKSEIAQRFRADLQQSSRASNKEIALEAKTKA